MASLLAESIKPQVFKTQTSAPLRVRDDRVSRFPHQRGHLLRIHQIFAAQRNEGYSIIAQRDSSSIFAP